MIEKAIDLLKVIENKGFQAYLVGGCVRDFLINVPFFDIDICTSATPSDIKNIFGEKNVFDNNYGSVILSYENFKYQITTFRSEMTYSDGRRPDSVIYVNDLVTDLQRRDFTINSICMDKNKNIIDIYNGLDDLNNKIIRTIGESDFKFSQDSLRILRAVRLYTVLDFNILPDVKMSIVKNSNKLSNISYDRRKIELDKIFLSNNRKKGIKFLIDTNLYKYLELDNLPNIVLVDDLLGIWAQLRNFNYPFKKQELKIIKSVLEIIDNDIDIMSNFTLYKYGLYVCTIVAKIKKQDICELSNIHSKLPINSSDKLDITTDDLYNIFGSIHTSQLKNIYSFIISGILSCNIKNKKNDIITYLKKNIDVLK